jgi:hypothetical protein
MGAIVLEVAVAKAGARPRVFVKINIKVVGWYLYKIP